MRADKQLINRVVLISGALGSIGQAIALELGGRGAKIALSDIHEVSSATDLLERCKDAKITAKYRQVDVAQADRVNDWISDTEGSLGIPDIVVPCAAVVTRSGLRELDSAAWRLELQVNLDGSFHLAQRAALRMVQTNTPGNIVFIGSWVAERPHPRITTYCVGKAALRMLMKCMALELAPNGILVNEVAPGYVDAGLTGETLRKDPDRRSALITQTPIGRLIEPEEVAFHVANLCDPRSAGITGTTLLLDGGLSLRTP